MDNDARTPAIRFAGFTDDWERCKLGDMSDSFEYGLNAAAKDFDGKYKYIRITDIDDETRVFDSSDLTSPDIDLTDAENYQLREGDIVFARTGASVGKTYIYRVTDGLTYYAGFLIRARIKEKYCADFVFQNTLTKRYEKFIHITSQRSGQPGVNAQEYSTYEIAVPKYEEQIQIGRFFRNLDQLIILQQRKYDKLVNLKKSMLERMFPRNGANIPEIRFAGFTDVWKQRKLGEVAELTSSKRIHAEDYVNNGVPFYRGKEISELREHKPISEVLYIAEEKYNEITNLYGSPAKGDLLITAVGTIGNTWVVDKLPFYFKDGNLIWFKNIKCDAKFLDYALSTPEGRQNIDSSTIGSNQKALTIVKLKELNFMFPDIVEQQQIVDYFDNLDNLIVLQQRKAEKLKNIKKSCLEKMLI